MEKYYGLKQKARLMRKWFNAYSTEMTTFLDDLEEGVLSYSDDDFNRASEQFDEIQRHSVIIQDEFEIIQKLGGLEFEE